MEYGKLGGGSSFLYTRVSLQRIFFIFDRTVFLSTLCVTPVTHHSQRQWWIDIIKQYRKAQNFQGRGTVIFNWNEKIYTKGKESVTYLTLSQTSPGFYVFEVQVFWNHWGKGEIACCEQFVLFPEFSTRLKNFLSVSSSMKLSANSFGMEESKICRLEKGYKVIAFFYFSVFQYININRNTEKMYSNVFNAWWVFVQCSIGYGLTMALVCPIFGLKIF